MPQGDIRQTYKTSQVKHENVVPNEMMAVEFRGSDPTNLAEDPKRIWARTDTSELYYTVDGVEVIEVAQATAIANLKPASLAGRRWCFLGDSITNGSNATNFDFSYSRVAVSGVGHFTSRFDYVEAGVPGERADQAYARMDNLIKTYSPTAWVVLIGTNDANQGVTPAVYWEWLLKIINKIKLTGAAVVVCTVPPRSSGSPASAHKLVNAYNVLIRLYQNELGYELAEVHSALVDPTTGYFSASYDTDGIHPNDLGHQRISQVVGRAMARATKITNQHSILQSVLQSTQGLISGDPLNARATATTSPWFEIPGGTGTAPTYSMINDTSGVLAVGRWAQMDFDATASGGTRRLGSNVTSGFTAGDTLLYCFAVQIEDTSGTFAEDIVATTAGLSIPVLNQSSVPIFSSVISSRTTGIKDPVTGFYNIGPIAFKFIVPGGVTSLNFHFGLTLPTGKRVKLRIGEVGFLNLTTLNLETIISESETAITT